MEDPVVVEMEGDTAPKRSGHYIGWRLHWLCIAHSSSNNHLGTPVSAFRLAVLLQCIRVQTWNGPCSRNWGRRACRVIIRLSFLVPAGFDVVVYSIRRLSYSDDNIPSRMSFNSAELIVGLETNFARKAVEAQQVLSSISQTTTLPVFCSSSFWFRSLVLRKDLKVS